MARQKSLLEAYILGIPFGIFGAHHFYLGRTTYGVIHLCTLGLFGIGYVVDLFRMKWLVDHANKHGTARKELSDVYILGAIGGILGAHHFYLDNRKVGIVYLCTAGVFGIGWIVDLVRMRWLVRAYNNQDRDKSLVTAYVFGASPLGLFGAHHYYVHNYGVGLLYTFTFGVFGIGWIVDLFRMKWIVKHSNFSGTTAGKSLGTAYIIGVSPLGLFGGHHYYLGNYGVGMAYSCTLGIFLIGWVIDLFRMRWLVQDSGGSSDNPKRSVGTAYILGMSPLGVFGASHYYLGNYVVGFVYTCTAGVFGIGWIIDFFQMATLVEIANSKSDWKTLTTAYIFAASPLGIFGGHHFYLGRTKFGIFYCVTVGLFGMGWLFDLYRLPTLFKRSTDDDRHKYVDDAYMYWLPFGLFGVHHFYLKRYKWGILYACTLGCLGIGFIFDAIRMKTLVKQYNEDNHIDGRLIPLKFVCYCTPYYFRQCCCSRRRRRRLCSCNCRKLCTVISPCCYGSRKDVEMAEQNGEVGHENEAYRKENEANYRQNTGDPDSEIPEEVRVMNEANRGDKCEDLGPGTEVPAGAYYGVVPYEGAANPNQVDVEVNQQVPTENYSMYPVGEADQAMHAVGSYTYPEYDPGEVPTGQQQSEEVVLNPGDLQQTDPDLHNYDYDYNYDYQQEGQADDMTGQYPAYNATDQETDQKAGIEQNVYMVESNSADVRHS